MMGVLHDKILLIWYLRGQIFSDKVFVVYEFLWFGRVDVVYEGLTYSALRLDWVVIAIWCSHLLLNLLRNSQIELAMGWLVHSGSALSVIEVDWRLMWGRSADWVLVWGNWGSIWRDSCRLRMENGLNRFLSLIWVMRVIIVIEISSRFFF